MISVFVPAFNEEENLPKTLDCILAVARELSLEVECLVVDDGSTDRTPEIIRQYAFLHANIRGIFHATNLGMGTSFRESLGLARYDRITMIPGDHIVSRSTILDLFKLYDRADVVLAYTVNVEYRNRLRRSISSFYTWLCKVTFNLPVRYIHATPVFPVHYLRELDLKCERYSFPSEATIKCLRGGCSYLEIPGYMNPDARRSSAVRVQNAWEALTHYLFLVYEVFVKCRARYRQVPRKQIFGTSS